MLGWIGSLVAGILDHELRDRMSKVMLGALCSYWITLSRTFSPRKAAMAMWISLGRQKDLHGLTLVVPDEMASPEELAGWEIQQRS